MNDNRLDRNEIKKRVKKRLEKPRYEHTKGVMYTAGCLAMAHGYSVDDAMLAGLLHDCAKCIPDDEKIKMCKKNGIPISPAEAECPDKLLHAKLGAFLAETEYGVRDPQILHAIRVHTTGAPGMSLLDKIIYIADYIEPGRDKAPDLPQIRMQAFSDLNACMAQILMDSLRYLKARGGAIDPATRETFEFYKGYLGERGQEGDI